MIKRLEHTAPSGGRAVGKCCIIGCGKTGGAIAYTLMKSGVCRDLVLVDTDPLLAKAEASALSGALPFCAHTDVYCGDEHDLCDCGVIVFALEADTSPHLRAELLRKTAKCISALDSAPILLNATYPMEQTTQLLHAASGLAHGRVFGVGCVTECVRLRKMLGRHLCVNSAAISVFLVGGSVKDTIPIWSQANVAGISLSHYCSICGRGYDVGVMDGLFRTAWEQSGESPYTVAEAVRRILLAIARDENVILPLTCPVQGHYALENVSLCLPAVIGRSGVRQVLEIPLDDAEDHHLRRVAERVREG